MATYYTDWAVGNDGNLGTSEGAGNAWKTIDKAMNTVAAGDTVYVKATGPYLETPTIDTPGTNSSPIVFEGYTSTPGDGGQATVDAESTRSYCLADTLSTGSTYYVFKNLIFKRAAVRCVFISVQDIIFKNCRFTDSADEGCTATGEMMFENCLFDNNAGDGVVTSINQSYFFGCRFANNGEHGARLFNSDAYFFDCVFAGNDGDAIESLTANGSHIVVVGCTIDGDGKTTNTGIDCSTSYWKRVAVINTIIYDCTEGIRSYNRGGHFISRNNLLNNNTTDYTNFQTFEGEVTDPPQFADEAGGDYSLGVSSPALNVGFDGYLQNGSAQLCDIGAIESTSADGSGGRASRVLKDGSQMT